MYDQNGQLRKNSDVFNEVIKKLGKIENETERDATAMTIFGESAKKLNTLMLGGADALEEYGDQAQRAGLILSQDELDSLNKVSDAMDTLKATTTAAGNVFMVAFAEPISNAINIVTSAIQNLVKSYREDGVEGLISASDEMVKSMIDKISTALPTALKLGGEIVGKVADGILKNLPELVRSAIGVVNQFAQSIFEPANIRELTSAAVEILLTVANGISSSLDVLIPAAFEAIDALIDGLLEDDNLGKMLEAAAEIMFKLAMGLIENLPELIGRAPEIIDAIFRTLTNKENEESMFEAGRALGKALEKGIAMAIKEIFDLIGNAVDTIISFFDTGNWNGWQYTPSKGFGALGGFDYDEFRREMGWNDRDLTYVQGGAYSVGGQTYHAREKYIGDGAVINITTELDGTTLAQTSYRYNEVEAYRRGVPLVEG